MAIEIQCDAGFTVSQYLGDDDDRHVIVDEQCSGGMAQVVQSDAW